MNDIEIAVVGHSSESMPEITSPILKPVILDNLQYSNPIYRSNCLAESRLFLADNVFSYNADIIGCLSASWDKKYVPNKLNNILYWPESIALKTIHTNYNIVYCASLCHGNYAFGSKSNPALWEIDFQKHFRLLRPNTEWIQEKIYSITGLTYNKKNKAPYANQIICHHTLFYELCFYIKSIIDDVIFEFGLDIQIPGAHIDQKRALAYILEEITLLWWSNHDNIHYISCGDVNQSWYGNTNY